ncbi:transposase [Gelidibacter japonicus]|uniref:transposase n=1 Tax=Gelidibacter japonicus TaxID=1962232 RepID=UPI0020211950|nr:transposase [Gelidibacter japonicus]MCL8008791.1 transposase [Gelidibacter japonicus]
MDKVKTKNPDSLISDQERIQLSFFSLSDFVNKTVEVKFSAEQTSTDGGLLLLKEVDRKIGLIENLTSNLGDDRHLVYVKHNFKSHLSQRIMQIAAGYEDANDYNTLRNERPLKKHLIFSDYFKEAITLLSH